MQVGLVYKFVFRAVNSVGEGQDSDIAHYAFVDVPSAPSAPRVMLSHTSESQVAVEWDELETD